MTFGQRFLKLTTRLPEPVEQNAEITEREGKQRNKFDKAMKLPESELEHATRKCLKKLGSPHIESFNGYESEESETAIKCLGMNGEKQR